MACLRIEVARLVPPDFCEDREAAEGVVRKSGGIEASRFARLSIPDGIGQENKCGRERRIVSC